MLDSGNGFEFGSDGKKVVKATGGLITLVNRTAASLTNCDFQIIIPGRATRLAITAGEKVSVTFNVHNERLTPCQFLTLENRILLDIAEAKANPHRFSMNIAGDLNVPPPGSDKRKLDTPSAEGPAEASPRELHQHRPFYNRWANIFAQLTK